MTRIYIDGDACPVKDEVYRVAGRYQLPVIVVGNAWLRLPDDPLLSMIVVPEGPDVADDRIVELIEAADICVTNDIPLASRCLLKKALAIRPNGKPFTENSIGDALATRDLMSTYQARRRK
ncbi:MAG: YaiI/YqxD family protein [Magnetospirillum sp.]|nr:YaiI/YqxD family protein [Magnetospirillum sp.]